MLPPLVQLGLLIVFAIVGVMAGVVQMNAERECACCGLQVSRTVSRCPHCRCRVH
jgi:hypothetical protein